MNRTVEDMISTLDLLQDQEVSELIIRSPALYRQLSNSLYAGERFGTEAGRLPGESLPDLIRRLKQRRREY